MGLHEPKTGLILTAIGGFSWFSFSSLLFILIDLSTSLFILTFIMQKTRGLLPTHLGGREPALARVLRRGEQGRTVVNLPL